ncbi:ATP-dependent 6-phosphofructokinase [Desulfococcaceae bacterium HSG9]|nr:ATP-dependent 6-phosphofructokinase [Desulfococcaceae bacterium HSG9]
MDFDSIDTTVPALGKSKIQSPIRADSEDTRRLFFVSDQDRVIIDINQANLEDRIRRGQKIPSFEAAGPRAKIYFDPSKLRCALVTCGGLCPGLNDIIRSIVLELYHAYGVHQIYGARYGLQGFIPAYGHDFMNLTPQSVTDIHYMGGTVLGSSRGPQPIEEVVDCLERMNIRLLFMIGGDGTLRASSLIVNEITARNLKISVVSIPKTIDNDIYLVARSFGFETAVSVATQAIVAAHNEAKGYPNGIGLIKLMGRYSGFIAASAAIAQQDVNFVLIPEADFDLHGNGGLLDAVEKRLQERKHAVIVVAEGAGQKFFKDKAEARDESGNMRLMDIGRYLKKEILAYFKSKNMDTTVKYIDPSYMIRSLPANSSDNVYCSFLGRDAVHAGMAGKTGLLVGHWNNQFVHVPMSASVGKHKQVSPDGTLWLNVLAATGQGRLKNCVMGLAS